MIVLDGLADNGKPVPRGSVVHIAVMMPGELVEITDDEDGSTQMVPSFKAERILCGEEYLPDKSYTAVELTDDVTCYLRREGSQSPDFEPNFSDLKCEDCEKKKRGKKRGKGRGQSDQ